MEGVISRFGDLTAHTGVDPPNLRVEKRVGVGPHSFLPNYSKRHERFDESAYPL